MFHEIKRLEAKMSAEFDALKAELGIAIDLIRTLTAKIVTPPVPVVPDPAPADIVAATDELKVAVAASNAALNPVTTGAA